MLKEKGHVTEGIGYTHTVVDTIPKFKKFFAKIRKQREFTVDVETDGLPWWDHQHKIICCAFCFEDDHAYVIPFRKYKTFVERYMTKGKKPQKRRRKKYKVIPFWTKAQFSFIKKRINWLFQNENIMKTLHNAKFDFHHLWNDNIRIEGVAFDDTMIMQHLVDENTARDLKTLATLCAPHMAGYEREIKAQEEYAHALVAVKPELLYKYNAGDVVATRFVKRQKKKELMREGLWDFYATYGRKLLKLLFQMELKGAYIGQKELKAVDVKLRKRLAWLKRKMVDEAGTKFNPDSPKVVADVLFNQLRYPVIKLTKKGASSTDSSVLETLRDEYNSDFAKYMMEYRETVKLHGTYVKGISRFLDKFSTLHTTFRSARTVTGRLSSSEPNLQNIPKEGPIKSMFIALPNYRIIAADLSQAELRVIAAVAQDEVFLDAFARGEDAQWCLVRKRSHLQCVGMLRRSTSVCSMVRTHHQSCNRTSENSLSDSTRLRKRSSG
jgi:DNA polymerase I-like protein with 3'-5' exonuclease and polymerase domains